MDKTTAILFMALFFVLGVASVYVYLSALQEYRERRSHEAFMSMTKGGALDKLLKEFKDDMLDSKKTLKKATRKEKPKDE